MDLPLHVSLGAEVLLLMSEGRSAVALNPGRHARVASRSPDFSLDANDVLGESRIGMQDLLSDSRLGVEQCQIKSDRRSVK